MIYAMIKFITRTILPCSFLPRIETRGYQYFASMEPSVISTLCLNFYLRARNNAVQKGFHLSKRDGILLNCRASVSPCLILKPALPRLQRVVNGVGITPGWNPWLPIFRTYGAVCHFHMVAKFLARLSQWCLSETRHCDPAATGEAICCAIWVF